MTPKHQKDLETTELKKMKPDHQADALILLVARHYGVQAALVYQGGAFKFEALKNARAMVVAVLRKCSPHSYPVIANLMGFTNHTSALAAERRALAMNIPDSELQEWWTRAGEMVKEFAQPAAEPEQVTQAVA